MKLLACPVCGNKPKVSHVTISCCVLVTAKNIELARHTWNTRQPMDDLWRFLNGLEDSGRCCGARTTVRDIKNMIAMIWE